MENVNLLEGGTLARQIRSRVKERVARCSAQGIQPRLAAVVCSTDEAALAYAKQKERIATKLGIDFEISHLPEASQADLEDVMRRYGSDDSVNGVILELPTNENLDPYRALDLLPRWKDTDGLGAANQAAVLRGEEELAILPATPQACIHLIESTTTLKGKSVTLVGRGKTVGRPLLSMLVNRHATVTLCHTKSASLEDDVARADIVVVATGCPATITSDMLSRDQIVVDSGTNYVNEKLVGDVDTTSPLPQGVVLTPVPGGVGPVTTALIFQNLIHGIDLSANISNYEK